MQTSRKIKEKLNRKDFEQVSKTREEGVRSEKECEK